MVVDRRVSVLPTGPTKAHRAISVDPMAYPLDPAELLGVEMEKLSWALALVASNGLLRLQRGKTPEPLAAKNPRHRRTRDLHSLSDLPGHQAPTAKAHDPTHLLLTRRRRATVRPRASVDQAFGASLPVSTQPPVRRTLADAGGGRGGLRPPPVLDPLNQ
jgi:hypothetical protein